MSQDHQEHHGSSVGTYVLIALILGVITYFEFAIIEFEIAWLGTAATIFWLIFLSLIKFFLVIWFFMHLKDDEKLYSGFFASGMVFAMGTFIVLSVLFTLASFRNVNVAASEAQHAVAEHGDGHDKAVDLAALSAVSLEHQLMNPSPKNQGYNFFNPAASSALAVYDFAEPVPTEMASDNLEQVGTETDDATELDVATVEDTSDVIEQTAVTEQSTAEVVDTTVTGTDDSTEISDSSTVTEVADTTAPELTLATFEWQSVGERTYNLNCIACHQVDGGGIAGVFPPHAGHLPTVFFQEGGRDYLAQVLLYGLQGDITALGLSYDGVMPARPDLSDEELAAALNYALTSWDNDAHSFDDQLYLPQDIAAFRDQGLSANDVLAVREGLGLD